MIKVNNLDKNITILLGGEGSEAKVSIDSGEEVYKCLKSLGYKVSKLGFDKNVADNLIKLKTEIVFNALHGKFGEDGSIQGMLDIMQIPYTHSGLLASGIAMNKVFFRQICQIHGILSPKFSILKKGEDKNNSKVINNFKKPFVIKPISEGSSVGVEIITQGTSFDIENYHWNHGSEIVVEEYIKGKELNVAIFDNKALGSIQVIPKKHIFYDYESKYTSGMTNYVKPDITKQQNQELMDLSLKCHNSINCKDISRVEFILSDEDKKFYLLEINTHPGITPLSLVPKIAQEAGVSFEDLITYLINNSSYLQ